VTNTKDPSPCKVEDETGFYRCVLENGLGAGLRFGGQPSRVLKKSYE